MDHKRNLERHAFAEIERQVWTLRSRLARMARIRALLVAPGGAVALQRLEEVEAHGLQVVDRLTADSAAVSAFGVENLGAWFGNMGVYQNRNQSP